MFAVIPATGARTLSGETALERPSVGADRLRGNLNGKNPVQENRSWVVRINDLRPLHKDWKIDPRRTTHKILVRSGHAPRKALLKAW